MVLFCCVLNMSLFYFKSHLKSCEYEKVKCPNKCNMEIFRIDLDKHENECPMRVETCEHCSIQVVASQLAVS